LIHHPVIPANAGIQYHNFMPRCLDTGFRRYDSVNYDSNTNVFGIGAKGGKAKAANLTPERQKEIAKNAAAKHWNKYFT
jgi:hypothetical protein